MTDFDKNQDSRLKILIGEYPIQSFPPLYQKTILKIASFLNTYVDMIANSMLAELAYILSFSFDAATGRGDSQPLSLFALSIAESGDGKDATFRLICKASEEMQKSSFESYKTELQVWKTANKKDRGIEPSFDLTRFESATTQGITDQINKSTNKSFILCTAEGGSFFCGYTMTSDTVGAAVSTLNNLVDLGSINNVTKGQEKIEYCNDIRFSVLLAVQSIVVEPSLKNKFLRGQGFLARVLFACPDAPPYYEKTLKDIINIYEDEDLVNYWNKCKSLLSNLKKNSVRGVMLYNENATQKHLSFENYINYHCLPGGKYAEISSYAKRSKQYVWRVASILAFIDDKKVIDGTIMNNAMNICYYSLNQWLKYYAKQNSDSDILYNWLVKKRNEGQERVLISSITQYAPNPLRVAKKRDEAILHLIQSGKIIKIDQIYIGLAI